MILFTQRNKRLTCEKARDLMFDYIDGETSETDTRRLDEHLAECPDCRAELEERRQMLEQIKLIGQKAPPRLYDNVMSLVECTPQELPKRSKKLFGERFIPIGTLSAACVVAVLALVGRGAASGADSTATLDIAARRYNAASLDGYESYAGAYAPTEAAGSTLDSETAVLFANPFMDETKAETTLPSPETFAYTESPVIESDAGMSESNYAAILESSEEILDRWQQYLDDMRFSEDYAVLVCSSGAMDDMSVFIESIGVSTELDSAKVYIINDNKDTTAEEYYTALMSLLDKSGELYISRVPRNAEFNECFIVLMDEENQ